MARVLLGVTGGIAAYKACELVRLLVKDGHDVTPVLTPGRRALRHGAHLRGAGPQGGRPGPLPAPADADLLVIAPLSANTLAKLAHGLADNVLTQAALAVRGPVLVAPAMNVRMWEHPATQENVRLLVERGVHLIGPEEGELAEGEHGAGRMSEPADDLRPLPRAARRRRARCAASGWSSAREGRASRSTRSATSATAPPGRWASRSPREARRRGADGDARRVEPRRQPPEASRSCRRRRPPTSPARCSRGTTRTWSSWPRPSPTTAPPNRRTASGRRTRRRGRVDARAHGGRARRAGAPPAQRPAARRLRRRRGRSGLERARDEVGQQGGTSSSTTTYLVLTSGSTRTGTSSSLITRAGERAVSKRSKEECAVAILDEVEALLRGRRWTSRPSKRSRTWRRRARRPRTSDRRQPQARHPRAGRDAEFSVLCLLSEGHLIIEDFPGVGKTTLAKSLARSVDCSFSRLQFTPDLLPSDVTGVNVFNQRSNEFEFRPGPVFANILLVDEINRASPKTQSALLECMQERQVTIDGVSYQLAPPFMVMATQNPIEYEGTYPLPEAELDRFTMRIAIGYPPLADEARMLSENAAETPLDALESRRERPGGALRDREREARLRRGEPQPLRRRRAAPLALGLAPLPRRQPARGHRAPSGREGAGARGRAEISSSRMTSRPSPRPCSPTG